MPADSEPADRAATAPARYRHGMSTGYSDPQPTRAEIDALGGPQVVEFGNDWCGHCQRARPLVEAAFAAHPQVPHARYADGPGRALGRSFKVKLWPTLVFLRDGVEVGRVVRPQAQGEVSEALARITGA
jgi:thioredoxin 1